MKTQEELKKLKQEYETLAAKLKELSEEELKQVVGGFTIPEHNPNYDIHVY